MEKFVHQFKALLPSSCIIRIVDQDDKHMILFENTGDGVSVTNASEIIASEIIDKFKWHPANCRFFETYKGYERVIEIQYSWIVGVVSEKWEANHPDWSSVEQIQIKNLFELE
ncbi:MAG: hypothetical protein PHF86_01020 [Candidatus Nanoarchaeia archaeon]|nr:hypothetical protein [Candidatus Nanoarchaeia archaeon]